MIRLPIPLFNCYKQSVCSYKPHPTQAIEISAGADVRAERRGELKGEKGECLDTVMLEKNWCYSNVMEKGCVLVVA